MDPPSHHFEERTFKMIRCGKTKGFLRQAGMRVFWFLALVQDIAGFSKLRWQLGLGPAFLKGHSTT